MWLSRLVCPIYPTQTRDITSLGSRQWCAAAVKQELIPVLRARPGAPIMCIHQRRRCTGPVQRLERTYADRVRWTQSGQSEPVRTDRARTEDGEKPDRLGLARADRLSQDRRAAGGRAMAAAPGASSGPRI